MRTTVMLLLLVWQTPLGVRSAKRRHQSPQSMILNHSYRHVAEFNTHWTGACFKSVMVKHLTLL